MADFVASAEPPKFGWNSKALASGFFGSAKNYMLREIRMRFRNSKGPGNKPWPRLSPVSTGTRRKGKKTKLGTKPLVNTRRLQGSIAATKESEAKMSFGTSLRVGNHNLGAIHHFGARPRVSAKSRIWMGMNLGVWLKKTTKFLVILARPFLFFSEKNERDIEAIIDGQIDRLM
jgi:phage gpG-like protein